MVLIGYVIGGLLMAGGSLFMILGVCLLVVALADIFLHMED